jgi:type I restriction enzyme S subunit
MEKNKMVPELRFSEFSKSEKYTLKKYSFDDIFLFSIGKNIKQGEASPNYETPCVRYGELYHMYTEVIKKVINRTNIDKSELCFSEGNEILLPSAGEDPLDIGSASALTIKNIAIGRTINILRPKSNNLYSHIFVSYYINQKLKKDIAKLAKGVSISNVYNSDLKKLNLILPPLKEQQKIAQFLFSVDQRIQLLEERKEKLQAYKKGVMQQIFSQQIRFKQEDGSDFPEWEEKKLGDMVNYISREVDKPDIKFLALGIRSHFKGTFLKYNFDPDKIAMETLFRVKENDLIVNITFAWEGAIAIVKKDDDGALVSHRFPTYEFKKEQLLPDFFEFIFPNNRFKKILSNISPGGAGRNRVLNRKDFLKIKIETPCIEEQKKISSFFKSIDSKINQTQTQIDKTKEFKKGLLQKMFV